jgi:hypothetical protein
MLHVALNCDGRLVVGRGPVTPTKKGKSLKRYKKKKLLGRFQKYFGDLILTH